MAALPCIPGTAGCILSIPGDTFEPPYPGAPGKHYTHGGGNGGTLLFGFEGYNIRRVLSYIDPATGQPCETEIAWATGVNATKAQRAALNTRVRRAVALGVS
jgi:hypothetical protein